MVILNQSREHCDEKFNKFENKLFFLGLCKLKLI
jgi:hypothetical protein